MHTSSFITAEEIRNYKSLEAYKYFLDGWVIDTSWKFFGDVFLLIGRVKHSYALNDAPLRPWVAVTKSGRVEHGHCTCMAGLAESCSHVAALLYWLETAVRINADTTCTSKPNSWIAPSSMPTPCQHVPYVTLEELENIAPSRMKHKSEPVIAALNHPAPTQQELDDFYKNLKEVKSKPAILGLVPGYDDSFVQSSEHLPQALQELYNPRSSDLNYTQLLNDTRNVRLKPLTTIQVEHLEESTRGQAKSHLWFKYRAGRITSSTLHQVIQNW